MPRGMDSAHNTSEPQWRDAGASERERLTVGLVASMTRALIERALGRVGTEPSRWKDILGVFGQFPPPQRDQVYAQLEEIGRGDCPPALREVVWESLRKIIARNTRYASAEWALREHEIARLDAVEQLYRPSDLVQRHVWLFDEHFPTMRGKSLTESAEEVDLARQQAIDEIARESGISGMLRLATVAKYPGFVAQAAARQLPLDVLLLSVEQALKSDESGLRMFASAAAAAAFDRDDVALKEWIRERASSADAGETTLLLERLPDRAETWEFVRTLGDPVWDNYWKVKPVWHISDESDLQLAVKEYLARGRAIAVLDSLGHQLAKSPDPETVFALLDSAARELAEGKTPQYQMFGYHIQELLGSLRRSTGANVLDIAKREYQFLPLLDHAEDSLALHRLLSEDPQFFAEVVSTVFTRRTRTEGDTAEPTESERQRASISFRLLSSWKEPPATENGVIDEAKLKQWVSSAREALALADRAEVGDQKIGEQLAWASSDSQDGVWPPRVIREIIESVASEDLETGLELGQFNHRGVVTKSPFEGGGQERQLAATARAGAVKTGRWPRTSSMLTRIAESWERYAVREDEEVEQRKARGL